jgi:protein-tyrosine sulfotransferase
MSSKPELALVVGAARSGTTLTRLLLDAHAEVACPSEAGLPGLMAHMAGAWANAMADQESGAQEATRQATACLANGTGQAAEDAARAEPSESLSEAQKPVVPQRASEWIAESVTMLMLEHCAGDRKRIYCDKSLDSVHHLQLVSEVFPKVRIILVFRHVMDAVVSGIEASPWGFQAYGYGPFVQAHPGNFVAALASYWVDHVGRALTWEEQHPEMCHRLRYEDLVTQPEVMTAGMQRFLQVRQDPSVVRRALRRDSTRGPGDYKIEHTRSIHADSVGRGKRVPVTLLPAALLDAVNEQLTKLGYEAMDRAWNSTGRRVDGETEGGWAQRLTKLMSAVAVAPRAADIGPFAVVADDHRALRWVIDPARVPIPARRSMEERPVHVLESPRISPRQDGREQSRRAAIRSAPLVRVTAAARGPLGDLRRTPARPRRATHTQHLRTRDRRVRGSTSPARRRRDRERTGNPPHGQERRRMNQRSAIRLRRSISSRCSMMSTPDRCWPRGHQGATSLTPRAFPRQSDTVRNDSYAGSLHNSSRPETTPYLPFTQEIAGSNPAGGIGEVRADLPFGRRRTGQRLGLAVVPGVYPSGLRRDSVRRPPSVTRLRRLWFLVGSVAWPSREAMIAQVSEPTTAMKTMVARMMLMVIAKVMSAPCL